MKLAGLTCLTLLAGLLLASAALADNDEQPRPLTPYDCEEWNRHIETLQDSGLSLERELGELYGRPDLQFCQVQSVRVTQTRDTDWSLDWLDFSGVAWLMRSLAIVLLLGLVLWLAWRWRDHFRAARSSRESRKPPPGPKTRRAETLSALPDDIPGAALAAWQTGHQREAMSLLYRGAVARLLPEKRIIEAQTEREVITALKQASENPETLAWMKDLVNGWLKTAWANRPPNDPEFMELQRQWSHYCPARPGGDR